MSFHFKYIHCIKSYVNLVSSYSPTVHSNWASLFYVSYYTSKKTREIMNINMFASVLLLLVDNHVKYIHGEIRSEI